MKAYVPFSSITHVLLPGRSLSSSTTSWLVVSEPSMTLTVAFYSSILFFSTLLRNVIESEAFYCISQGVAIGCPPFICGQDFCNMFTITHITTNHRNAHTENMSSGVTSITKRLAFAFLRPLCWWLRNVSRINHHLLSSCLLLISTRSSNKLSTFHMWTTFYTMFTITHITTNHHSADTKTCPLVWYL
jgi:hypothetical protein